jgi:hypothetical protein
MSLGTANSKAFGTIAAEIGAAGGSALRRTKDLAELAPKGRFFASIATLNELGAQTLEALEEGDLPRATHVAAKLAAEGRIKLPSFFRKKA